MSTKTGNIKKLLLLLVFIIGVSLRLYKIDTVPYGINHDGAWSGLWAIELSQKPWPIQVYSNRPWLGEAMPRYVIAFFIKLLGPTLLALKLGMMVFTIIALPLFYLMVKNLFGSYTLALFSTFLLATSGWDITYGKTGWRVSAVPVFVITTVYFLLKALKTTKTHFFALTGMFMALTLNTYNAGQFIPLTVFGTLVAYLFTHRKHYKTLLAKYLVLTLAFVTVVTPLARYAITHWENYTGRAQYLFVFNKVKSAGSFYPVWENIKYAALMYTVKGHFGADFYLSEPLLDFPTNWLFVLGLVIALLQIRKTSYLFLYFLFFTSLIPSLTGNPDGGHAIGTLPVVYTFAGLGLFTLHNLLSRARLLARLNIPQAVSVLVLISAFFTTFNLYLGPNRREMWGFYPETTVVANYIKPKLDNYDVYLTDNYPRDTLTYLTYRGGDPWQKHYTWLEDGKNFLRVSPKEDKGLIFIMFKTPSNQHLIDQLQAKYPQGKISVLTYIDDNINRPAAWIFTVDRP